MLADEGPLITMFLGIGLVGAVFVAGFTTYYVAKLIVDGVRRSQAAKLEAQARENQDRLKSLMIQRGMSADEIERVLKAEGPRPDYTREAEDIEAAIVEVLSENGYEAEDIERILRAARGDGAAISPSAGQLVGTLAENWAKTEDIERILQTRHRPAPA
jgi:hypothetical protein